MGFLTDLVGATALLVAAPIVGVSKFLKGEDLSEVGDCIEASATCLGQAAEDLINGDIL